MRRIVCYLMVVISLPAFGQANRVDKQIEEISIQFLEIKDLRLLKYLGNYILKHESENDLFMNGLGFIVMDKKFFIQN